jgi:hypothetical protein
MTELWLRGTWTRNACWWKKSFPNSVQMAGYSETTFEPDRSSRFGGDQGSRVSPKLTHGAIWHDDNLSLFCANMPPFRHQI